MEKTKDFSLDQVFSKLPSFTEEGITELALSDEKLAGSRNLLSKLVSEVRTHCPDLFVSIRINASVLDARLVGELQEIYCSLEIPLVCSEKNGTLLFDKKLYSSKARLLNDAGLVFGFTLDFGLQKGDTFKQFRDRLDFAASLYPNHIDFPQLEGIYTEPKSSGVYSSKDLDFSRGIAFACKTFYTCGRAVPWFNSVTKALKIPSSTFFADFEEWQQCNNCSFECGFDCNSADHSSIEKMQLNFLEQKFEEKHKSHLFPAVKDLVSLNGAFSRAFSDSIESIVETSYYPDDILSPYGQDIVSFTENVTMESCSVKVFQNKAGEVDYKLL